MGEMADDAFDRAMEEAYGLGRGGDWGDDYFRVSRPIRCHRCGKVGGLHWRETIHGWRLDEGNQPHQCVTANDFEDLGDV